MNACKCKTNLPSVLVSSPSTSIMASLSSSFSLWISRISAPFLRRISSSSERSSGLRSAGTVKRKKERRAKWGHRDSDRKGTEKTVHFNTNPPPPPGLRLISFTLWCEMETWSGFGDTALHGRGLRSGSLWTNWRLLRHRWVFGSFRESKPGQTWAKPAEAQKATPAGRDTYSCSQSSAPTLKWFT